MNRNKRIYLSPPHMTGREKEFIADAFQTNMIAPLGPNVDRFEKDVMDYTNMSGAVAVSSGTAAIHLALRLLDVKANDRVFCSTFTFIASANPILYQSGVPVFIDSEPETWNMSPDALLTAFKEAEAEGVLPKAVIVVHLYGQSAKMDEILEICDHYKVPVIEDAAESLGSLYKHHKSGSMGKFGVYSFNGNKIITTSGGGMLVSNDVKALDQARFLATQARDKALHYEHSQTGYNYRMSNILAGVGIAQMEVINERVDQKKAIFNRYQRELGGLKGLSFMEEAKGTLHNRWLSTLLLDSELYACTPEEIVIELEKENIESRPLWKPLHLQPLFKSNKFYPHTKDRRISEELYENGLCLPSGTGMTNLEQKRVIEALEMLLLKKSQPSILHA
ncbi:aminotransferase class I/II-fold pyridoxal phosphate-dependent enzyme [Pseudalkalibacillus sp. JSM 102089]|uniref:aminotransferase class I/II-fold pyridoxal phosphate-dependent enzyme n=1 Tax=Pseudalkalibacillus sp. JSM 102089 TaxID=3229856 RepID=UPI0035245E61